MLAVGEPGMYEVERQHGEPPPRHRMMQSPDAERRELDP